MFRPSRKHDRSALLIALIEKYNLFNAEWYAAANSNLNLSESTAWTHFQTEGVMAGFSPTPLFDSQTYLETNPDVAASGTPAFLHYMLDGAREERQGIHYLISLEHIASQIDLNRVENGNHLIALATTTDWVNPRRLVDTKVIADQVGASTTWEALNKYAAHPNPDSIVPHYLFDPGHLRANAKVPPGMSALEFYIRSSGAGGASPHALIHFENILPGDFVFRPSPAGPTYLEEIMMRGSDFRGQLSALFDVECYLSHVGDNVPRDMLCLEHFMREGWKEGHRPNHWFDPSLYAARYLEPDSFIDPLTHYAWNGREPIIDLSPDFDQNYYVSHYPEVLTAYDRTPLEHYLSFGLAESRQLKPVVAWTDGFDAWSDLADEVAAVFAEPIDDKVKPDVAVIIPVYNQFHYTLRCIWSIIRAGDAARLEIFVADDGSCDETEAFFSGLPGIRYVRHPENLGFLRSCNRVAEMASAPVIYFLNNDTAVLPGWMDRVLDTFGENPDAGLVGSKLIYPDGQLQEAGCFVYEGGKGCNVGRNKDPAEPGYNFLREVEYVSGAGIAIPRDIWTRLGGFDERYLPAYCEDTDFALALRQNGWRVLYQPKSEIIHFEGISSGRSLTSGVKAYQVVNQDKLQAKWAYSLEGHIPNNDINPRAIDRPARPRICVIDSIVPTPDQDSGSLSAFWFLKLLVELGYDVSFLPKNGCLNGHYGRHIQSLGVEVLYAPYVHSIEQYLRDHGHRFDLFFLYRVNSGGKYQQLVKRLYPNTPVIFDTVDLHYLREERKAKLPGAEPEAMMQAQLTKQVELGLIKSADATVVVSELEYDILSDMGLRAPLFVIPLVMEILEKVPPRTGREGIAFVGGYQHTPNVDAVLWFCETIWPCLREMMPDLVLHIVGSNPPEEITYLDVEGVVVHGFIPDLDGFLSKRIATVAPLRYGAGVKGKVGSSLAAGVPCVATPIAVEGMGLRDGENVLVAEDARQFAEQLKAVVDDNKLWNKLSKAGQTFVHDAYSPDVTKKQLMRLLAQANAAPFSGRCPITGVTETRRFAQSDLADTLVATGNGAWSSERVLCDAYIRRVNPEAASLPELDQEASSFAVSSSGRLPVLNGALDDKGLLSDSASAPVHLARIPLDDQATSTLKSLLDAVRSDDLFVACPSISGMAEIGSRQDAEAIERLVQMILETGEWDVRVNRNALKETPMTKVILIEARRKGHG